MRRQRISNQCSWVSHGTNAITKSSQPIPWRLKPFFSTRRSHHKKELHRLSKQIQSTDWLMSWPVCRMSQRPNNTLVARSTPIQWPLIEKVRSLSCFRIFFTLWLRCSPRCLSKWRSTSFTQFWRKMRCRLSEKLAQPVYKLLKTF